MQIETYLEEEAVPFERMQHDATFTAQGLAAAEHVPGRFVAKPVLVRADDEFVLCVVPACYRLDLARVADVVGAEEVHLASESDMRGVFCDCEVGAEPPFGNLFGLDTIVDQSLHKDDYVVFQAGTHTSALRMTRADYEAAAKPVIANIAHHM